MLRARRPTISRCSRSSRCRHRPAVRGATLLAMNGVLDELVDDIEYWERLYERLPASVTVIRQHTDDIKQRQMIVWLDGERIATLMFGDQVTRDLDVGRHRLR